MPLHTLALFLPKALFRLLWRPAARMWEPVSTRFKMWKYFDKYAFGLLFTTPSVSREWVWNMVTAYESCFSNYTWHCAWLWAWQDTRWWQESDVDDTGFALLVKIFYEGKTQSIRRNRRRDVSPLLRQQLEPLRAWGLSWLLWQFELKMRHVPFFI